MSRVLDAQCARALGWTQRGDGPWYPPGRETTSPLPAFSAIPEATRLLEDEIERRGLQDAYIRALFAQVIPEAARWDITLNTESGGYIDRASLFLLLRATPEQRARAFLEVV